MKTKTNPAPCLQRDIKPNYCSGKVSCLTATSHEAFSRCGINLLIILISFSLLIPSLSLADGGMMIWPPTVHLDQSAQNAIVAWDGEEEIIILSNDIESSAKATVLRMIPLSSNPSEIKEGSFESFGKLVEIMNKKLEEMPPPGWLGGKEGRAGEEAAGIEITFQEKIGAHDVTVVKVNDLDYFLNWIKDFAQDKGLELKEISSEFKEGVANYLKRDIKYFVFDVIEAEEKKESINPLIYRFNSDFLYYPLLITGISEVGKSRARVDIFLITEKEIPTWFIYYQLGTSGWGGQYSVGFSQEDLNDVSEEIANLFDSDVKVRKVSYYGTFDGIKKDLMAYPSKTWEEHLVLGNSGEEIKALQKILINEKIWDSDVEATGFFGPITKNALAKFQEKYSGEILRPVGLKIGTGFLGKRTQDYLRKLSIETEKIKVTIKWNRNLTLGTRGDDVKALQEILIKEKLWGRPDVGATGFFGPITRMAVIKFQEKYSSKILAPLGLAKGTGFVGSSTRAYLEELE